MSETNSTDKMRSMKHIIRSQYRIIYMFCLTLRLCTAAVLPLSRLGASHLKTWGVQNLKTSVIHNAIIFWYTGCIIVAIFKQICTSFFFSFSYTKKQGKVLNSIWGWQHVRPLWSILIKKDSSITYVCVFLQYVISVVYPLWHHHLKCNVHYLIQQSNTVRTI